MENKNILVSIVAIVAIVVGIAMFKPANISISNNIEVPESQNSVIPVPNGYTMTPSGEVLGASAGSDVMFPITYHDSAKFKKAVSYGNGYMATSTATSATTLRLSDLEYGFIKVNVEVADLTYTLPATSTLKQFVPNVGDTRQIIWYNSTSTAGIDTIFAAGTGMEIKSTAGSGALTLDEGAFGIMTFVRKADTDILVFLSLPDAD